MVRLYTNILDTLKGQELMGRWDRVESNVYGASVYLTFTGEIRALQRAYEMLDTMDNTREMYIVTRHPMPLHSLADITSRRLDKDKVDENFMGTLQRLYNTLSGSVEYDEMGRFVRYLK